MVFQELMYQRNELQTAQLCLFTRDSEYRELVAQFHTLSFKYRNLERSLAIAEVNEEICMLVCAYSVHMCNKTMVMQCVHRWLRLNSP